jgi:hypothetical protein
MVILRWRGVDMMWLFTIYWIVPLLLLLIPIIGLINRWMIEREWKQFENDLTKRNEEWLE